MAEVSACPHRAGLAEMHCRRIALALLAGTFTPMLAASAQTASAAFEADAWTASSAWALAAALLVAAVYAFDAWRRRGTAGSVRIGWLLQATALVLGLLALCVATIGPLQAYGRWSLGAHMGQHMLLFAYVPALLVAARPPVSTSAAAVGMQGASAALVSATALHSAVMWFWHHPAAITSTLYDDRLQLLMHASFIGSGLWFWSALRRARAAAEGPWTALLALVAIMMQMGLLGALLVFSGRVLYPVCTDRAPLLGLEPMSDQQLAGLIMWVPACLPYLLGAVWLMRRWLCAEERAPLH
jgi:putative membrane protein